MKIVLFANTDWYLYNFRRSLAQAIRDAGHDVLLISPPGAYADKLVELGFRWLPAPLNRRSLNPVSEVLFLAWLWKLLSAENADIIHGFTIKCAVYGSIVARIMSALGRGPSRINAVAGMGYVFTSRDFKARFLKPIVRTLMRFAFGGKNSLLVVQNPTDLNFFILHKIVDPRFARLIPGSGVNCNRFFPASDHAPRSPSARLKVLLPARLLWDKGLAEFIEATRALQSEGAPIDFLLAGTPDEGNPASVPPAMVDQWAQEGLVSWLGHVDDMPELFRSVDIVALPSYREGLPKGLIEAAATGLALITTDAPGCRDVVDDGVTGIVVPVRDSVALQEAIRRLQLDPHLRMRLGAAAREKARLQFADTAINTQTVQLYYDVGNSGAASR